MTSFNAFEHDGFNGFRSVGYNARNGGGGCPALLLTIAGLDAAVCCVVGDWWIFFGTGSTSYAGPLPDPATHPDPPDLTPIGYDGDYLLTASNPPVDGICTYQRAFPNINMYVSDGATCDSIFGWPGPPAPYVLTVNAVSLTLKYDPAAQKVKEIILKGQFVVNEDAVHELFLATSIDEDLGVAIANQITVCEQPAPNIFRAINGGTMEVNLAA